MNLFWEFKYFLYDIGVWIGNLHSEIRSLQCTYKQQKYNIKNIEQRCFIGCNTAVVFCLKANVYSLRQAINFVSTIQRKLALTDA